MRLLQILRVISLSTLREAVRGRLVIGTFFVSLFLLALVLFFGLVTIGDQVRVIKDFGLTLMSVAGAAFAAVSVAGKLEADLRKRTIYNVLAKSVSRSSYILGSYLGLLLAGAILITAIWSAMTLLVTLISGELNFYPLFVALIYSLFEWSIICAIALLFSSVTVTPMLPGFLTFGAFLAGRSYDQLQSLLSCGAETCQFDVNKLLLIFVPQLSSINIANSVTFNIIPAFAHTLWCTIYSVSYCSFALALTVLIFNRRQFQ